MDIKSLQLKQFLIDDNNDFYKDLSISSINQGSFQGIMDIFRVDFETEMRPDLICLKYYGSTEHIDVLLKANNIFNPFSIEEGKYLIIPSISNKAIMYNQASNKNKKDLRSQFIDKERMSKHDANRIDRLKNKANGKKGQVKDPLPTNMLQVGETTTKLEGGKIKLGTNLT